MLRRSPSATDKHLDALEQNADALLRLVHRIVEQRRKKAANSTCSTGNNDVALQKEVAV